MKNSGQNSDLKADIWAVIIALTPEIFVKVMNMALEKATKNKFG